VSARLRAAVPADTQAVLALWGTAATPTSTDTATALRALIEHDPGALIVADEVGEIVGTVVAGWDGWRGSVYRLAVAPPRRRQGLGARLLRAAEDRLAGCGARRVHAVVVGADDRAVAFWEATDWTHERGQRRYTKSVVPTTPGAAGRAGGADGSDRAGA